MPPALIILLGILGLALIWLVYTLIWGTPFSINLAVERLSLRMILIDPEMLTYLGLVENTILDFHSGSLTDASPRYMRQLQQLDRDGYALMSRYDPDSLTGQQKITHAIMCWYYEQNLRGHRFGYHWVSDPVFMGPYPVNHVFGVQVDLINFLSTYHRIKGARSIRRYLKRLELVSWKMTGLRESLHFRLEQGVIPPKFVLEKTLKQIDDFLARSISENPLLTSFMVGMSDMGKISKKAQARWGEKVQTLIDREVLPAYRDLRSYLEGLLEQAGEEDGVWRFPDGQAYYAFLLRTHTTTELSPQEVHQLGLTEVERLTESIKQVLEEMGLPSDDPGAQMKALMADTQYHYETEGDSRQQIIADYQAILDEVNNRTKEVFHYGPLDEIVVKRLPEYREPDSPIAYAQPPSLDGSRPGTLWLNLRDPGNVYRWGMRTLAYHEGIPGHVYQMAQAQKIKGLPTFRRNFFFNAYVEGWALYAEQLGWELGLEDAASNLGRLQALLWRAVRLVVDTGIHVMQWARQEAADYMMAMTGLPERDVITEIERYIVMPGQACAYYLGYLKLVALRKKAQSSLGERFDFKEFHDVVINNGGLPLSILEIVVDDYVDRTAGMASVTPEGPAYHLK